MRFLWRYIARVLAWPRVVDAILAYAKRRPYSHLYSYMGRWWLMPRALLGRDETNALFPYSWLPFSIRLHHILREDAEPDVHDHPRSFRTIILRGWYDEEDIWGVVHSHLAGDTVKRDFHTFHRITRVSPGGVWTLFIMGPRRHEWGFLTGNPARKVHWRKYKSKNNRAHLVDGDQPYIPEADVIKLDDHRPRVAVDLVCMFCHSKGPAHVVPDLKYYPCPGEPGCEEIAAVPQRKTRRIDQ